MVFLIDRKYFLALIIPCDTERVWRGIMRKDNSNDNESEAEKLLSIFRSELNFEIKQAHEQIKRLEGRMRELENQVAELRRRGVGVRNGDRW